MNYHVDAGFRLFILHVQCTNCLEKASRDVKVPRVDEAPADVDELLESAFLQNQKFVCRHCDNPIGKLIAVSQEAA